MRTIKVEGSGPLADYVAYATVAHMDICSDDGVVLDLGEVCTIAGDREFSRVTVSALTGALKTPHGDSDLLFAAQGDREYLKHCWDRWWGR